MNNRSRGRAAPAKLILSLLSFLLIFTGLAFALPLRTALAQAVTPTGTVTATATLAPTTSGTTSVTPAATANGTTTGTPAAGAVGTSTLAPTLAAPALSGTPTVLVPVTGADLTHPGGGSHTGMWIAIWLLGLLLAWFGLRLRLSKRRQ